MYEVGDLVEVKTECELQSEFERYRDHYDCNGLDFVDDMLKYCGCEMTVGYVDENNSEMKLEEDEEGWWFNASMVKPVTKPVDLGDDVLQIITELITG